MPLYYNLDYILIITLLGPGALIDPLQAHCKLAANEILNIRAT